MARPTHPRPSRPLAASWARFDVDRQLENLKQEPEWLNGKRNAITLLKEPAITIVLIALRRGDLLPQHQAGGPITLLVLSGRIAVRCDGETLQLAPRELLALEPGLKHEVEAVEESAFVLTVVKAAGRR